MVMFIVFCSLLLARLLPFQKAWEREYDQGGNAQEQQRALYSLQNGGEIDGEAEVRPEETQAHVATNGREYGAVQSWDAGIREKRVPPEPVPYVEELVERHPHDAGEND